MAALRAAEQFIVRRLLRCGHRRPVRSFRFAQNVLAAHVLEPNDLDDRTVDTRARADLPRWFPHVDLAGWQTLAVVRTPRSQFQQPPHVRDELPSTRTHWPGLYLACECTEESSLNGAMRSGEAAARAVTNDLQSHLLESTAGIRGVTRMSMQRGERMLVVGAGYRGVGTALRLARRTGGRTGIHLMDGRAEHKLITRLHEVAAGMSVQLHRTWVEGIDVQRRRVITSEGVLEYDRLVLAPGSQKDYRRVSAASELTLPLRTLEEALRLREKLVTLLRGHPGRAYSGKGGSR
jgi:hypothetical protein